MPKKTLIAKIVMTTTRVRFVASSREGQTTLRNSARVSRTYCTIRFGFCTSLATAISQISFTRLFRLAMQRMFSVVWTILFEFQATGIVLFILLGRIVPMLAFGTLERDD